MTRVKFVIYCSELTALFPDIVENAHNQTIMCYVHIGQHGQAHKSLMSCKAATKEQYEGLLKELISRGYDDLKVMNKL